MSRIIVKNLPFNFTEERLREVFSSKGIISDARLIYTSEGKFRKFGFVGFKQAEDAEMAVEYFNKSFLDSSRLQVEIAKPFGDQSIPRPWSRHSAGSSAHKNSAADSQSDEDDGVSEVKREQKKEQKKVGEEDPKLQEFMALYERGTKKKTWANDTKVEDVSGKSRKSQAQLAKEAASAGADSSSDESSDESDSNSAPSVDEPVFTTPDVSEAPKRPADDKAMSSLSDLQYLRSKKSSGVSSDSSESESSDDELASSRHEVARQSSSSESSDDDLPEEENGSDGGNHFTVKMTGLPFKANEGAIRNFFAPLRIEAVRIMLDKLQRPSGIAFVDFARSGDVQKALRRNRKRMGGRYIEIVTERLLREKKKQSVENKVRAIQLQEKRNRLEAAKDGDDVEPIGESGRLFVTNLPYTASDEDLKEFFEEHGPVSELVVPVDKKTKKRKGVAIVTYLMPENAVAAFNKVESMHFQGRVLHVQPARAKVTPEERDEATSSYKKKKATKQKNSALRWTNWNSLFLGADAVADEIAAKYGASKGDVLDASGSQSVAVRLALGESSIVSSTRLFLLAHGVDLEAVTKKSVKSRSSTIILVKDLPHGTKEAQLTALFSPFGDVIRTVLPPSGVSGIVEFAESFEASAAFGKLCYSMYQDRPLYLEWAPLGIFNAPPSAKKKDTSTKDEEEGEDSEDDGADAAEGAEQISSVFVKNLNFSTNNETLMRVFSTVGPVVKATIATKPDPKKRGSVLSMGYGFVEFKDPKDAKDCIKKMQKHPIDGHNVELKMSGRTTRVAPESRKRSRSQKAPPSKKIMVRNIPFEANRKEIHELFMAFGQVQSVRLPKKTGTNSHRGFGFVEYVSKMEAQRAFEALHSSTHVYGRRLVLEWSTQDESVDSVRTRTASHFHEPLAKRKKIQLDGHDNAQ